MKNDIKVGDLLLQKKSPFVGKWRVLVVRPEDEEVKLKNSRTDAVRWVAKADLARDFEK